MMFRVVFLLALLFPGIASAACALGPNPNWWGCTTPLSGAAQGTDMLDAGRPSLGVRASGPITINQLFQAMTGAQVAAALGYTALAPANNLSEVTTPATALTNLGGVAASGGNASATIVQPTGGTTARTQAARAADTANVADFGGGAKCDGTTNDLAAFTGAIATGKPSIVVPGNVGTGVCVVTGSIVPQSNQSISGMNGRPTIKLVSGSVSTLFNLTGLSNVTLKDLITDGTSALAGGNFFELNNAASVTVQNVDLISPPGSPTGGAISLSGTANANRIIGGTITNAGGNAAVLLSGASVTANSITGTKFSGATNFSIRALFGANRTIIDGITVPSSGIEPVAFSLGSNYNLVTNSRLEGSGDNCISIVGDHNIASHNILKGCAKSGLFSWGSYNLIEGNTLLDNNQVATTWPCLGAAAQFGATGQFNQFVGNTCDDDQAVPTQFGLSFQTLGYTVWSTPISVSVGDYYYFGLNVYQARTTATTGASAPTCTGTPNVTSCSDGTVTWLYQSTFQSVPVSAFNTQVNTQVPRYAGTQPLAGVNPGSKPINRNPDFMVSQANENNAIQTLATQGVMAVDGWRINQSVVSKLNYQHTSGSTNPGYGFAEKITSVSAYSPVSTDQVNLIDRIESIDIGALKWGTANALPVAFDTCVLTAGITGNIAWLLDNNGGGGTYQTYAWETPVSTAGVWTCSSTIIPGPTGGVWASAPNTIGLRLTLGLVGGTSTVTSTKNAWQAAGPFAGTNTMMQLSSINAAALNVGYVHLYAAGAPYIPRTFIEEIRDAQNWYWKSFPVGVVPAQGAGLASALCTNNPIASGFPGMFVRAAADIYTGTTANYTITTFNPSAANANWRDVTAAADVTVAVDPSAAKGKSGAFIGVSGAVTAANDNLCIHVVIDSGG